MPILHIPNIVTIFESELYIYTCNTYSHTVFEVYFVKKYHSNKHEIIKKNVDGHIRTLWKKSGRTYSAGGHIRTVWSKIGRTFSAGGHIRTVWFKIRRTFSAGGHIVQADI